MLYAFSAAQICAADFFAFFDRKPFTDQTHFQRNDEYLFFILEKKFSFKNGGSYV